MANSFPVRDDPHPTRPVTCCQRRQGSTASQHPALALAHRDALAVEILHQRDGVFARDAQEVLHVAGTDLLLLLEVADQLVLDGPESLGVEVERLLGSHQTTLGHQELEELVTLVSFHAEPTEGLLRARRRRACLEEFRLQAAHHALLLGAQPDGVSRQAHLVLLASDDALRLEPRQELGEDALLRIAGAAAELLARDARAQRILDVKRLQETERYRPQSIIGLAVQIPFAIDGNNSPYTRQLVQ